MGLQTAARSWPLWPAVSAVAGLGRPAFDQAINDLLDFGGERALSLLKPALDRRYPPKPAEACPRAIGALRPRFDKDFGGPPWPVTSPLKPAQV